MSLHGKIVAWFAFFAAILATLFVLGDYYQSTKALRVVLESRAGALAREASTEIERRYERSEAELKDLGRDVVAGAIADTSDVAEQYSKVRIFREDSLLSSTIRKPEALESYECAYGSVPFVVRFADMAGHRYRVEATMSTVQFFSSITATTARLGRTGVTAVLSTESGAIVYDNGCVTRSKLVPASLVGQLRARVLASETQSIRDATEIKRSGRDHLYLVSIVRASHPAWSVAIALDYDRWAEPFKTARTEYFAIMIAFMLVALLFTFRMIRHDMQRLTSISHAADAIGHGRFDVWLPPPTGDEVGRLSLALGQMVNRLGSTMRQMEASAAMAAVGELATYLSHEIRNPLSSIRLNLQMLKRDLRSGTAPDDAQLLVKMCLAEMQRLDDVVSTVLDAGKRRPHIGTCDAHEIIRDTVHIMSSKLAVQGISMDLRLAATHSEVAMNGGKLKSVLINLLVNSVEALAASPVKQIWVSTEAAELADGSCQMELRVIDSGPGVRPDLASQIFEQFFTTKASGSGIGLTTVRRLLEECGGTITCVAADGDTGGHFVLGLPLANVEAATSPALAAAG